MTDLNQPVRSVLGNDAPRNPAKWPFTIPAVVQLLAESLDLNPYTFLVGDNGSGKSTVVETSAEAYGLNAGGRSTGAKHAIRRSESVLAEHLTLSRATTASRWGYFFRAETMHGLFTCLEQIAVSPGLHEHSHGEAFREIITTRCFHSRR